jgi:predicted small secreted protein
MRPRPRLAPLAATLLLSTLLAACHEPTGVGGDISRHRARWAAHVIASYDYDYELDGFFIDFAGRPVRVEVRDGAVRSATDVATGQPMPQALTTWPTVEQLFDTAERAAAAGSLRAVRYDPTYDYPTSLELDGPPDASGSVTASGLVPVR